MKKCENPLIPEITKTSKKRLYNLSDLKLPKELRKVCVWCLGPLKGQQRRWCGEECVESAQAWAHPQKEHGLGVLLLRQDFKCNTCQYDWGAIVEAMYQQSKAPYGLAGIKETWRTTFSYWIVTNLKYEMNRKDKLRSPEVDHILAISKGGQSLGSENHQAICYTCHKAKTKIDNSGPRKKKVDKTAPVEDTNKEQKE